jgi:hypothetical protein
MKDTKAAGLRGLSRDEMARIEGGTWMETLNDWLRFTTLGAIGYGSGGLEGPYGTGYKSPKGGNDIP